MSALQTQQAAANLPASPKADHITVSWRARTHARTQQTPLASHTMPLAETIDVLTPDVFEAKLAEGLALAKKAEAKLVVLIT